MILINFVNELGPKLCWFNPFVYLADINIYMYAAYWYIFNLFYNIQALCFYHVCFIYDCLYIRVCVFVFVSIFVCVCVFVWVSVCVSMCECVCIMVVLHGNIEVFVLLRVGIILSNHHTFIFFQTNNLFLCMFNWT